MNYKKMGRTGLDVSELCFGTMTFGNEADRETSRTLFDRCRDEGINFFDCADVYSNGEAERILGGLISDCREEVVITSKVYFSMGEGPNKAGISRKRIVRSVEESLKRLGTDYIDLYFLHHFDEATPLEESLRALEDVVRQGKVVYVGASNFAAWQIAKGLGISRCNDWPAFSCIQPMYSLLKRQAEVELLPMAASEGVGVITYSPLGAGMLTGKYLDGLSGEARFSHNTKYQVRYGEEWMQEATSRFVGYAREHGYDPAALAVAWVAHHPAVTAPIIGARNLEQLESSLSARKIDMTGELYQTITDMSPTPPPATDRIEERSGL